MKYFVLKSAAILVALCTLVIIANGQLLQKSVAKIRSYKNMSYTDVISFKFSFQEEFSIDTVHSKLVFNPGFPAGQGYYHINYKGHSSAFDGNKLVGLNYSDSTYNVKKDSVDSQFTRTLLHWVRQMEKSAKMPSKNIKYASDTVINGIDYANIEVVAYDSVINNQRSFDIRNFIIDKKTQLPIQIKSRISGLANDGSVFGFIEIHSYRDYQTNLKDFPDLSNAEIPSHFSAPKPRVPVKFLANGTPAPPFKAVDFSGVELDLAKLKGKMVLINFSLIGCPHCVGAAQMLNRLNDKFNGNLVILNVYPIDQKEAIVKFDKKENVKTTNYISDRSVQKIYPYDGYPSFYLIDKNGIIVQSYNGFYKELESQLIEKIKQTDK